jgi:prefoldin subunit 5
VELTSSKVTIGSAAHCTLRLVGCGLAAVELFLLRGNTGTFVQNASPRNRLNGRAFTEAQLVAGDRLAVGSIEFELVGKVASEKELREPENCNEERQLRYSQDGQEIESLRQRIDLLEQEQRHDHAHWRAEQEQWIEELMQARQLGMKLQEALDEQASSASQLAQEELQELRHQRDQLQQEADHLTSQLAELNTWQERATQAEAQLEQANQARQAVEQELQDQLTALQQEHNALRSEAQASEASLTETNEQIAALELDLAE